MAVSVDTGDDLQQFAELVNLVDEFRWIWDIKLTHLLVGQHFKHFPEEWSRVMLNMSSEEIRKLPDGYTESHWPDSLKSFISRCCQLRVDTSPPHWVRSAAVKVKGMVGKGMKPKKLHEVSSLAGVVHQLCERQGCDLVVDVGSGLGYLGLCLAHQCQLRVIGLEEEVQRAATAGERTARAMRRDGEDLREMDTEVADRLKELRFVSVPMMVHSSPKGVSQFVSLLDTIQAEQVMIVGLHCCGNLSPAVVDIVASHCHRSLGCLLLVPCCYHKMSPAPSGNTSSQGGYAPFHPLSSAGRSLLEHKHLHINCFGLRLAAQDSAKSWQSQSSVEWDHHTRHVLYRAILECVIQEGSFSTALKEGLRDAIRSASHQNIAMFTEQLLAGLQAKETGSISDVELAYLKEQLHKQWRVHEGQSRLIQAFNVQALQVCLQRPLESIILLDSIFYLREAGMEAHLLPVFNEAVSPRCIAVLATRPATE